MKHQSSIFRQAACWLSTLASLAGVHAAQAQGTAFTYQGRLNKGAGTANGSYDLTFSLFDAGTAGNQIGGTLTNTAVVVSNGLFVTTLDFGAGMFDGTSRWLEIGVSTNGDTNFAILSPRQAVTPTPYAIYAANAASAVSAASVAAGAVAPGHLATLVPPADGQVLAFTGGSLNWIDPAVAGGSIWSLNGSSTYYNAGNVGIGTTTPHHSLGINGSPAWTANGWGGAVELQNASAIGWQANAAGERFGMGHTGGGFYMFRTASDPGTTGSPALYDFTITDVGNVGIGTLSPSAKLTVYDPASVSHRIQTGGGVNAWARVEFANANGQWDVGTSRGFNGDQLYFNREGVSGTALALQPNGMRHSAAT
jgi:hypothetical protein